MDQPVKMINTELPDIIELKGIKQVYDGNPPIINDFIWVDIHPTIIFVTHDITEAVYLGDDIYVMGRNPGNIRKKFSSPLPLKRTRDMKRQIAFTNKVLEIEDFMTST